MNPASWLPLVANTVFTQPLGEQILPTELGVLILLGRSVGGAAGDDGDCGGRIKVSVVPCLHYARWHL